MKIDVFLDRDGTLVKDTGYISQVSDLEILKDVLQSLKCLMQLGCRLHLVSNQSGVGRGLISSREFWKVESEFESRLAKFGIKFDSVNFCFHVPADDCNCRKPKTGLLDEVKRKFNIDLNRAGLIGNSMSDQGAAKNFGIPYWNVDHQNSIALQLPHIIKYFNLCKGVESNEAQ